MLKLGKRASSCMGHFVMLIEICACTAYATMLHFACEEREDVNLGKLEFFLGCSTKSIPRNHIQQ